MAKDIEDAQNDVTNIDSRVTDTDENVMAMMAGIDLSRVIAEALKEETEEQEERLNNLEDVVEEVVENVEEIDKKVWVFGINYNYFIRRYNSFSFLLFNI